MKKAVTSFIVIAIVGLGAYSGVLFYLISKSPLTYKEIDLNNNGIVSGSEAEYASNYGGRRIYKNGKECIEFYAQKDGLTLKVVCFD